MSRRTATQIRRARAFHALHNGRMLRLPNAWDALSARIFASVGFPAVATTSAGVAWSLGAGDGERLPRERMLAAVRAIAGAVDLPVSADIESGYGATPEAVADTVDAVVAAGAVGINIEDGDPRSDADLLDATDQAERIAAAREAAERAAVPVFINARTDVFWRAIGDPSRRAEKAVTRGRLFADAGADGFFVPGATAADDIRALVAGVPLPLNLLAQPGLPGFSELARLRVARITLGSGPVRAAAGLTAAIGREFLDGEEMSLPGTWAMPYGDVQSLMTADARPPFTRQDP